jgi:maltose phosphorylase
MVFRIYLQSNSKILEYPSDHKRITEKVKITDTELNHGKKVSDAMFSLFRRI